MDSGQEMRFTQDVVQTAADRVNEAKDEEVARHATLSGAGDAVIARLGWDDDTVRHLVNDYYRETRDIFDHEDDPEERLRLAIVTALMDGLMIGAVAADVTYERSMGLELA